MIPHQGKFRVGEDDSRDRDVVELGRFAQQCLDSHLRFASRLVSQHRLPSHVAIAMILGSAVRMLRSTCT